MSGNLSTVQRVFISLSDNCPRSLLVAKLEQTKKIVLMRLSDCLSHGLCMVVIKRRREPIEKDSGRSMLQRTMSQRRRLNLKRRRSNRDLKAEKKMREDLHCASPFPLFKRSCCRRCLYRDLWLLLILRYRPLSL